MSTETTPAPPAARTGRGLIVLAASAAALAVWALAGPVAGVDLAVEPAGTKQHVGAGAVVAASLFAGLAGWASLTLLERVVTRPRRAWVVVAVVVLALSLTGPLGGGIGTAGTTALAGMHLIVGAVLIPLLARTAARR